MARTWLEEIRQTISDILRLPAPVADDTVVDVDTPVGVGLEMHALCTSRHEIEEERRRATALQAEENATMRRAMSRPPNKSRRLQIDIVARSGDDTSRARLHLPPLSSTDSMQIQLGISTVESNLPAEHEESTLMQTNMGPQRPLLKLLCPEARRRVLLRVLRDLRALLGRKLCECATMLREQREIEQLLDGSVQDHREDNDDDTAEDTFVADIADVHLQHLQAQMDCCFRPAQEIDVSDILRQLQQLQGHVDVVHDRMNASQEAPARRTCLGTERQVLQLANRLLDEIQEHLYNYEGTDRADLLREMVVGLVGAVQEKAATLLTLLHLVGHFLPQPFPVSELTSNSRAMGRSYARDVISTVETAFQVDASKELDGAAFGVSGILSIIPTLTHVATQSMVFLEDGHYDLDDIASPEGLPTEDTQDVDSPADINAPPSTHSAPQREWEEDTISRAMRASRQANLDQDSDFPGGGGSTLIGGSTSSSPPMTRTPIPTTKTSMPTTVNATSTTEPKIVNLKPPMMETSGPQRTLPPSTPRRSSTQPNSTRNSTAPRAMPPSTIKKSSMPPNTIQGVLRQTRLCQTLRRELRKRIRREDPPRQEICRQALREALQPRGLCRWTPAMDQVLPLLPAGNSNNNTNEGGHRQVATKMVTERNVVEEGQIREKVVTTSASTWVTPESRPKMNHDSLKEGFVSLSETKRVAPPKKKRTYIHTLITYLRMKRFSEVLQRYTLTGLHCAAGHAASRVPGLLPTGVQVLLTKPFGYLHSIRTYS